MKFGVATFFSGQGIGPAALAQALEERGFDSLFVTEHTHIPASRRTPYPTLAIRRKRLRMEQSNDGRAGSNGHARHGCSGVVVDVRQGNSAAVGGQ